MLRWTRPCTSSARVSTPTCSSKSADPPHRREQAQRLLAARARALTPLRGDAAPTRRTCCTAATILSSSGMTHASSGSLYGIVASSAVTCSIGAFSDAKPCSATSPAIADDADACRVAWSTSTRRPVFATDSRIVCVSSGASVRGSITSAWMPSPASFSAAPSARSTVQPVADDRHVAALAPDRGLAERHEVLAVGHLAVLEREQVVVEEDDRVVVADRGRHQALRVGRRSTASRPSARARP